MKHLSKRLLALLLLVTLVLGLIPSVAAEESSTSNQDIWDNKVLEMKLEEATNNESGGTDLVIESADGLLDEERVMPLALGSEA